MKSSFAARRKPRVIARDDPEDEEAQAQSDNVISLSAVKRPGSRPKNPASRQISFSAGASRNTSRQASDDEGEAFVVKKPSLSHQVIARNAQRKAGTKLPDNELSARTEGDSSPGYSGEQLALLKSSTSEKPSQDVEDDDDTTMLGTVDVAAKFGSNYKSNYSSNNGAIPSEAEIAEKKARRARLAQEMKYHATSDSDSDADGNTAMQDITHDSDEDEFKMQIDHIRISDVRPPKYPETRVMQHDDEDILEGFDEFTGGGSGRIELGRAAEKAAKVHARKQMADMIADAEGATDDEGDESDDSEKERRDVYDTVQMKIAMGSQAISAQQRAEDSLPPKLPPLPTLSGVIDKLRKALEETKALKEAKQRELEEVEQERREIAEREGEVQQALKETAENYQKLILEAGGSIASGKTLENGIDVNGALAIRDESRGATNQRGLESLAG